ncbi:MAG: TetR/AcrR family transcriptional regulator [Acidothermaceae bacterium]
MAIETSKSSDRTSARERLLAAADELFYGEGVHTVGIEKVLERAGVAKATLYSAFGSKDELVRVYLTRRHEARQHRITAAIEQYDNPRDKLLGIFDALGEMLTQPTYRGCAFVNASAESPSGGAVNEVSTQARDWLRSLFAALATEAGARDGDTLATQFMLLYDGASVAARMDHNPAVGESARTVATALLEAAIA